AETTTSPYSQEPTVQDAITAIKALPSDATAEAKQGALDGLASALKTAEGDRNSANNKADGVLAQVTQAIAQNATVVAAK
ncbi:hypothetical protein AADX85_16275, partial [Staphylococcus epidermidis]